MKKFLFMLVALLTISASTMSISAQVSNSFATFAAGDYAGTYNGDLTKVYMNTDKDQYLVLHLQLERTLLVPSIFTLMLSKLVACLALSLLTQTT